MNKEGSLYKIDLVSQRTFTVRAVDESAALNLAKHLARQVCDTAAWHPESIKEVGK
jgi:hypothetical protein